MNIWVYCKNCGTREGCVLTRRRGPDNEDYDVKRKCKTCIDNVCFPPSTVNNVDSCERCNK